MRVDHLLVTRSGFELLDGTPEVLSECLCAGTSLTLPHKRPLLLYHHTNVRFSKPLNLFSIGFGKLLCELVNACYICGLAFHCYSGGIVFIEHDECDKPDYHAEEDVDSSVEGTDGSVVRFTPLYGDQPLYQDYPRHSHWHGEH